ncbi:LRAT-like domain [Macleaya cordata]|uniref:LRAT-like domain n=1 Tax=Macleaya cordata TaxID=56857 RepID=A0A200PTG3_MACCD|nr:LRAT-like domain [Macleaya cordata]
MGLLSNRVERTQIKPGDHIYSWRVLYTYSHHGIYVGGSKVVHFTREQDPASSMETSLSSSSSSSKLPSTCPTFPDCGFRQTNSGVVLSCLDCFLKNGYLYCFEYGVTPSVFLSKVRGGTCTTATSDPPETVIHRAMYLLQNGFGNYDVFQNNCEDFAMYCKTGLLILDKSGVGRSGQASSVIGAPLAALLSSPLKLLIPGPVGVATVTAGMYCMSRYATDIGVRTDVIKVAVEDMAVNLGWAGQPCEEIAEEEASNGRAPHKRPHTVSVPEQKTSR